MRQVEIQAFSVEEAVRLALEQLGRSRDQVSVEVLATDPGSEEVLVRVTARDAGANAASAAAPDEEVSPRRRPFPQQGRGPGGPGPGPVDPNRRDRGDRNDRGGGGNRGDRGPRVNDRFDRPRGNRYDRPPGGGPMAQRRMDPNLRTDVPRQEEYEEVEDDLGNRIDIGVNVDPSLQREDETGEREHATPEDAVAPIAAEILQKVLVRMRVRGNIVRRDAADEGEAAFADDQPSLILNVTGLNERDQNVLIGRRGETLDALQFLVNLMLGRQVDLWIRVIIDIEGYRLRRKFALINLARRTADQVQARGQAIPLEAMPPYERRIIHMTLAEHPEVTTESSGVEPDRRVVVLPR